MKLANVLFCLFIAMAFIVEWIVCDPTVIHYDQFGKALGSLDTPVEPDSWTYYEIPSKINDQDIPVNDGQSIYFMVTPFSGDVDLYVTTNGKNPKLDDKGHCTNCVKESLTAHGDFVWLEKGDFPDNEFKFIIGVKNLELPSTFTLTVWVTDSSDDEGTIIELTDGIPQVAVSLPNSYTYFKFKIADSADIDGVAKPNSFQVAATSISGDPDICVSVKPDGVERCLMNDANTFWSSQRWGSDIVLVDQESEHFHTTGTYYIGVKAYTLETLYTISVTSNKKYTQVLDSQTMDSFVAKDETRYFSYFHPETTGKESILFNVQLAAYSGDPDMYIQMKDQTSKSKPPGPENCKWCASQWGDDSIEILHAVNGFYRIAVRGYQDTRFHFMGATEMNNIQLKDGVPVTYQAQVGGTRYFKYFHLDRESGLGFQAISATNNPLKMYLSASNSHPSEQKHDAIGESVGSSVTYNYPIGGTPVGTKYMAIQAPNGGNITVTAASNQNATPLQDSKVLLFNHMDKGIYRYFVFEIIPPFEGSLSVSVSAYRGEVDLFISNQENMRRPTKEKCHENPGDCWSSVDIGVDSITINSEDLKEGTIPKFWIGVLGVYNYNLFSIIAHVGGSTVELNDGVETPGSVLQGKYQYYKFYISHKEALSISLIMQDENVDADLYGSRHVNPDKIYCRDTNKCDLSTKRGNDVIYLQEAEPGWYYIGVYGYKGVDENTPMDFKIVVQAQYHVLRANQYAYVYESTLKGKVQQIHVPNIYPDDKYLVASVTLIGGRTRLFVTGNNTGATPEHYHFTNAGWPGNVLLIENTDETKHLFQNNEWSIGVEALESSDYFVSVASGNNPIYDYATLGLGIPRLSIAPAGEPMFFSYNLPFNWTEPMKVFDDYYLNVRIIRGIIALSGDQVYPMDPHKANTTIKYNGSRDVLLPLPKEKLRSGNIFFAVQGLDNQQVTFELTFSRGSDARYLIQDQPQQYFTATGAYSYFSVLNSQSNPLPITVTVESCDMNFAPNFYASSENTHPTSDDHDVASRAVKSYRQVMTAEASEATQYFVGVNGRGEHGSGSIYSIFATSHHNSKPVLKSRTIEGVVKNKLSHSNVIQLTIPRAQPPERFEDAPLFYKVFKAQITMNGNLPLRVNMDTVCGVEDNGVEIGTATEEPGTGSFKYEVELDKDRVYQIGVIVQDSFGLKEVYDGIWVVRGQVYPDYPNFIQALAISVGTVIILVLIQLISLFFGIGVIVNIVRGKKGFDVIPFKDFWKSLPRYFIDGVVGLFTCFCFRKKSSGYNNDLDEDDYGVAENLPPNETTESNNNAYGSL